MSKTTTAPAADARPWIRLQHHDVFAGWVDVRRAGKTMETASAVLATYRARNPAARYRLATLNASGHATPVAEPAAIADGGAAFVPGEHFTIDLRKG